VFGDKTGVISSCAYLGFLMGVIPSVPQIPVPQIPEPIAPLTLKKSTLAAF
jgi:hypothetical protein